MLTLHEYTRGNVMRKGRAVRQMRVVVSLHILEDASADNFISDRALMVHTPIAKQKIETPVKTLDPMQAHATI